MKPAARSLHVVLLVVLALIWTIPVAHAKGPTDVAVSGPGVDVRLTFTEPTDDVDSGTLGDASRVYDMWSPGRLGPAPDLTTDDLGPRYVLTWSGGEHGSAEDIVVQHAYPFAEGGGWVEFPPGQEMYGADLAAGWVRAPRLRAEMVELGAVPDAQPALAEPEASAPSSSAADLPAPASSDDGDAWSTYGVVVAAGVLLAGAAVAGVLIARRRQLSR